MVNFLTSQPLWLPGIIIVGLTTVGVLYAVFLAFAIIVVWEKYADAD